MNPPKYFVYKGKKLKKLSLKLINSVESEIKALLHSSRDRLRNLKKDSLNISFDINDPYYGEAFGIMRGLSILKFGYFGPVNLNAFEDRKYHHYNVTNSRQNLSWWFDKLKEEVLKEENFKENNRCKYCLKKYHKDDSTLIEKGTLKK